MCFNKETSIVSYLTGTIFSCLILNKGIKEKNKNFIITGIFFIVICLMQLNEYFIWKNQNCDDKNSFWSIVIMIVLLLQVIVLYICIKKYHNIKFYIDLIFIIFIILAIYSIIILIKNRKKLCSKPTKKHCRLEWASLKYLYKNNKLLIITVTLGYMLLLLLLSEKIKFKINSFLLKHFIKFALVLSVLVSIYLEKVDFFNIFGSLWCFIAVFFPLIYYFNLVISK